MLSFKNVNSLKTGSKAVVVVCTAVGSGGVVAVTSRSIAVDVFEIIVSEPKS